jgi:hypothetical protein
MGEWSHEADERMPTVVEPDTLLASQYFDRIRRRGEESGERRLMVAVLEDGVTTYCQHAAARSDRGRELFREAEAWIEDRGRSGLYAFENICDVLGLDADHLRRGLHARKERAQGERQDAGTVIELRTEPDVGSLRKASGD